MWLFDILPKPKIMKIIIRESILIFIITLAPVFDIKYIWKK